MDCLFSMQHLEFLTDACCVRLPTDGLKSLVPQYISSSSHFIRKLVLLRSATKSPNFVIRLQNNCEDCNDFSNHVSSELSQFYFKIHNTYGGFLMLQPLQRSPFPFAVP